MKKIALLLMIILFLACSKKEMIFSNFDTIEHFHLINDSLLDYKTRDSISEKIMNNDFPLNLNDKSFYDKLTQNNFSKIKWSNIDVSFFKNNFIRDTFTNTYTTACIPDYRDILILKESNKIVGIVKICIGCQMHYIIGENKDKKQINNSGGIENLELEKFIEKHKQ